MEMTRRHFLISSGLLAGAAATGYYSIGFEPRHLVMEHVEIKLRRLPPAFDGFRIAQLTDIHFGPNIGAEHLGAAVQAAQSFSPELLVLTGDFVAHPQGKSNGPSGARFAAPCSELLSTIRPPYGSFAILGNHDHWNDATIVTGTLQEHGITVLQNSNRVIEHEGARLWLAGSDDAFVRAADFDRALSGIPKDECTLLLAHEP